MSSNGRTADSGSVNGGSTPSIPAICAACFSLLARSSSGSGRRPLKAEITGSNPVRATMSSRGTRKPLYITARSSSGSGRRPLKAEITGSNPVRATKLFFGEPFFWFAKFLFQQLVSTRSSRPLSMRSFAFSVLGCCPPTQITKNDNVYQNRRQLAARSTILLLRRAMSTLIIEKIMNKCP